MATDPDDRNPPVDARLKAALRHAPDHDAAPPPAVSAAIAAAARAALARPAPAVAWSEPLRRFWQALAAPRPVWAGGAAALVVSALTLSLWHGEHPPPVVGDEPVAPAPPRAPAPAAKPVPLAVPAAPAARAVAPQPAEPAQPGRAAKDAASPDSVSRAPREAAGTAAPAAALPERRAEPPVELAKSRARTAERSDNAIGTAAPPEPAPAPPAVRSETTAADARESRSKAAAPAQATAAAPAPQPAPAVQAAPAPAAPPIQAAPVSPAAPAAPRLLRQSPTLSGGVSSAAPVPFPAAMPLLLRQQLAAAPANSSTHRLLQRIDEAARGRWQRLPPGSAPPAVAPLREIALPDAAAPRALLRIDDDGLRWTEPDGVAWFAPLDPAALQALLRALP